MSKDDIASRLNEIRLSTPPSDVPDTLTLAGQELFEHEKQKLELDRLKTELNNLRGAFTLSTWFAIAIFALVFISLLAVFGIIIWQGNICPENRLSDKVLMTLLSTTTVNILGLLYLVIKYVFHHRLKI